MEHANNPSATDPRNSANRSMAETDILAIHLDPVSDAIISINDKIPEHSHGDSLVYVQQ